MWAVWIPEKPVNTSSRTLINKHRTWLSKYFSEKHLYQEKTFRKIQTPAFYKIQLKKSYIIVSVKNKNKMLFKSAWSEY